MAKTILPQAEVACLYLRQSTEEQVASIPAQRVELTRYAKARGYSLAGGEPRHFDNGGEFFQVRRFQRGSQVVMDGESRGGDAGRSHQFFGEGFVTFD